MAKEEPFLMVSLKDDKTKKLAHALTNKSASKILNYLANNDQATQKQIAKDLKLPVSTVSYTIHVLEEAKLVTNKEFHYSEKGREVNHYSLARKYIIIAPQEETTNTFFDKLKTLLPAGILAVSITASIQLLTTSTQSISQMAARTDMAMAESADATQETTTRWYEPLLQTEWAGPVLITVFLFITFSLLIDYARKQQVKAS